MLWISPATGKLLQSLKLPSILPHSEAPDRMINSTNLQL